MLVSELKWDRLVDARLGFLTPRETVPLEVERDKLDAYRG
jgi:hypothetical protein